MVAVVFVVCHPAWYTRIATIEEFQLLSHYYCINSVHTVLFGMPSPTVRSRSQNPPSHRSRRRHCERAGVPRARYGSLPGMPAMTDESVLSSDYFGPRLDKNGIIDATETTQDRIINFVDRMAC